MNVCFFVLGLVSSVGLLAKRLARKNVSVLCLWIQWSWVMFSSLQLAWVRDIRYAILTTLLWRNVNAHNFDLLRLLTIASVTVINHHTEHRAAEHVLKHWHSMLLTYWSCSYIRYISDFALPLAMFLTRIILWRYTEYHATNMMEHYANANNGIASKRNLCAYGSNENNIYWQIAMTDLDTWYTMFMIYCSCFIYYLWFSSTFI